MVKIKNVKKDEIGNKQNDKERAPDKDVYNRIKRN
jgi:hypothetical protein